MSSTFTSNLGKLLENINRTSYAANAAIKNVIESAQGEDDFRPLDAAMEGFRLDNKVTGSQIVDLLIGDNPEAGLAEKIGRGALGFGIDVFADPFSYVGIGMLTKVGKVAKIATGLGKEGLKKVVATSKLGRMLSTMPDSQKVLGQTLAEQAELGQRSLLTFGDRAILPRAVNKAALGFVAHTSNYIKNLPYIKEIIKGAENIFKAKTGIRAFDDLIAKTGGEMSQMLEKHSETLKGIEKLMRKVKPAEHEKFQEYMYGIATDVPAHIKEPADKMKEFLGEIIEMEKAKGVMVNEIDNYFPGVVADDAMNFTQYLAKSKDGGKNAAEISKAFEYAKNKLLTRNMTPSQVNRLIKMTIGDMPLDKVHKEIIDRLDDETRKSLESFKGAALEAGVTKIGNKGEFFVTDPLTAVTKRAYSGVEAIGREQITQSAKKFGLNKQEWEKLSFSRPSEVMGMRTVAIKGLEGQYFPEAIAKSLERINKPLFNIDEMNSLAGQYKKLISFWKRFTLTIFPEYHARNTIGNFWNNYVVTGLSDPRVYMKAGLLQNLDATNPAKLAGIKITTDGGEILTGADIMAEVKQWNLLKSGMMTHDVPEKLVEQVKSANLNPVSTRFAPIRVGKKIGETVEDNGKLAHYLFQRQKGYSPSDAALSAKTALFDYNELTDFEKNVLRNIFPFYSWSRKNIPLQLKGILTEPGKYTRIAKGKEEFEEQAGTRETKLKWMPEWMQDSLPVIINRMPEGEKYKVFLLMNWLPAGDLNKLMSGDEFTKFVAGSLEPFSKEVLQQAMGKDFYLDKDIENYPGEMTSFLGIPMSMKFRHQLRMWRILNTVDQINPGEMFGKEGGQKSVFGAERDIMDLTPKEKLARFGGGIRLFPYDVEKGRTLEKAKLSGLIKKMEYQKNSALKRGRMDKVKELTAKIEAAKKKKEE